MSHKITVHLPAEQTLIVTANDFDDVTVNRLQSGQAPTFQATVVKGRTSRIGPFSNPRDFELISDHTTVAESYISEDEKHAYNHEGTGILNGGILSVNGSDNTKFDLSAGTGSIVDNYTDPENPEVTHVTWDDLTGIDATYLATNANSFVGVDVSGNIIQLPLDPTATERRNNIMLGILIHTNNLAITDAVTRPYTAYDEPHTLVDLASAVGIVNITGNVFSDNGANLQISKTVGTSFRIGSNYENSVASPNVTNNAALAAPALVRVYRDGAGGFTIATGTDVIDAANYDDDSGTLAAIPASDPWTIWRIYYAPAANRVICVYGQNLYKTKASAEAAIFGEEVELDPELDKSALRAYLIVQRTATALNDSATAKFIAAANFGGSPSGGVATATTNLQEAYENSEPDYEILTNSTQGPLTVREGTNDDTAHIFCGRNFADTINYRVNGKGQIFGAWTGGTTASRPATPEDYTFYFDTTIGKPIWYDGTNWVDATGATV